MTRAHTEITVVGDDDTGLVSRVTTLLFERGVNIEDVDQAVRDGVFRMTMAVDATEMDCSRESLRGALHALGRDLDLDVQVRFPSDRDASRVAVLATRESHCLEALLVAEAEDRLAEDEVEIPVVVSNRGDLRDLAERYGKPYYDIGDGSGAPDEDRLLDLLAEYDVDLVVLARYMRILGPNVVFRYEDRIINVHPSLLPAFPGAQAYRQAVEAGVRVTGATAHYVTTDLDQGPIVTQRVIDVPDDADVESLRRRGQPVEAAALLAAVRIHLAGATSVHRGRVGVHDEAEEQLGLSPAAAAENPEVPVDGERLDALPASVAPPN
ncbi:MAG: formyltetrahydrofolate deformylase [Halobacteriaceae archaeon]